MKRLLIAACLIVLTLPALAFAQDPPKTEPVKAPVDVSGTWDMLADSPQGQMNIPVVFKQDGEKLTGTQSTPMGEVALEGTVVGNEIKYQITIDMQGQPMVIVFGGTVEGDSMTGVYDFGGMGTAAWSAKKRPS
jgi:hypothetical protein